MSATAELLASPDVISHEIDIGSKLFRSDRREARRFVMEIRRKAQCYPIRCTKHESRWA